ncbi:hypothetical protein WN943_000497 [Citrus x changshan-huyou]
MDDKTKPVCTPLAPHFKLGSSSCPKSQEKRDYMARVPYASAVGSLMYAMVCTRPDISQAVSMVSRYMHDPGKSHWLTVKWILRYLYGTVDVGLLFKKDCGQQCVGYCDSDFAGDLDKRRSTTGYVFTLGGGPVSWRSILQSTIALSTTEAKYMAATEAVKEVIWLKGLLGDLGVIQENITVFCDNQSAIFLGKNQTYHARTKHIDVKYHYVREIIESGVVLLRKIDTKDNPSDMLTNVVSGVKQSKRHSHSGSLLKDHFGDEEIVNELLEARPEFTWKKDPNGRTPLHLCSSKGHLEITGELLKMDPDLSSSQDNERDQNLHVNRQTNFKSFNPTTFLNLRVIKIRQFILVAKA